MIQNESLFFVFEAMSPSRPSITEADILPFSIIQLAYDDGIIENKRILN